MEFCFVNYSAPVVIPNGTFKPETFCVGLSFVPHYIQIRFRLLVDDFWTSVCLHPPPPAPKWFDWLTLYKTPCVLLGLLEKNFDILYWINSVTNILCFHGFDRLWWFCTAKLYSLCLVKFFNEHIMGSTCVIPANGNSPVRINVTFKRKNWCCVLLVYLVWKNHF